MKINKTITFGAKDEVVAAKLYELGYFDKTFNFSSYIKKLIEKDIFENDGVFTRQQEDKIMEIVRNILQNQNISIAINKNEVEKKDKDKSTFESQNEVALDKDDDDLLDFAG